MSARTFAPPKRPPADAHVRAQKPPAPIHGTRPRGPGAGPSTGRVPFPSWSSQERVLAYSTTAQPGDLAEHQADRAAEIVTGAPGDAPAMVGAAACATEPIPPAAQRALASPGQPLESVTRARLEPRFGRDLGNVRIHADATAARSARSVGALAYTVGSSIVFGAGQYQPGSTAGQKLLAHELAHVVQQAGGPPQLQRKPGPAAAAPTRTQIKARIDAIWKELYDSETTVREELQDELLAELTSLEAELAALPDEVLRRDIAETRRELDEVEGQLDTSTPTVEAAGGLWSRREALHGELRARKRQQRTEARFGSKSEMLLRRAFLGYVSSDETEQAAFERRYDLDQLGAIVRRRFPDAAWYAEALEALAAQAKERERAALRPSLAWYQRDQLAALEPLVNGWTADESDLARDLLWQWFELRNQGVDTAAVAAAVQTTLLTTYERWLRTVDAAIQDECRRHPAGWMEKVYGDPCEPWFEQGHQHGFHELQSFGRWMRVTFARSEAPYQTVAYWVEDLRKRTNPDLVLPRLRTQALTSIVAGGLGGLGMRLSGSFYGPPPPLVPRRLARGAVLATEMTLRGVGDVPPFGPITGAAPSIAEPAVPPAASTRAAPATHGAVVDAARPVAAPQVASPSTAARVQPASSPRITVPSDVAIAKAVAPAATAQAAQARNEVAEAWAAVLRPATSLQVVIVPLAPEFGRLVYAVYVTAKRGIIGLDAFLDSRVAKDLLGELGGLTPERRTELQAGYDAALRERDQVLAHGETLGMSEVEIHAFLHRRADTDGLSLDDLRREMDAWRVTKDQGFPFGFRSAEEFARFRATAEKELARALKKVDRDARAFLQGSALSGISFKRRVPFDPKSDFDVAVVSRPLMRKAEALDYEVSKNPRRIGPLDVKQIDKLGLGKLYERLSDILTETVDSVPGAERDINILLFDTEEAMRKPIGDSRETWRPSLPLEE
jgi:hypothetical protein